MGYTNIAEGLNRCTLLWKIGIINCPVSTFLVQTAMENEYLLVDAGFDSHKDNLIKAVQESIGKSGILVGICITHAHLDHIAAIPELLELYPSCVVFMNSKESPFLTKEQSYSQLQGDSLAFNLSKRILQESAVRVDPAKIVHVNEDTILGGVIKCIESPGHTPGSMSYLHLPSRSLMVGDSIMNFAIFTAPCCNIMKSSTFNYTEALSTLKKLLTLDIFRYYPAHDENCGITREDIQEFLQ